MRWGLLFWIIWTVFFGGLAVLCFCLMWLLGSSNVPDAADAGIILLPVFLGFAMIAGVGLHAMMEEIWPP